MRCWLSVQIFWGSGLINDESSLISFDITTISFTALPACLSMLGVTSFSPFDCGDSQCIISYNFFFVYLSILLIESQHNIMYESYLRRFEEKRNNNSLLSAWDCVRILMEKEHTPDLCGFLCRLAPLHTGYMTPCPFSKALRILT